MDRARALARFSEASIARLATIRPDSRPHLVPVVFVVLDERIWSPIDHKPKTTDRLTRLSNIDANENVSILVDHFDRDWNELWWVRIDGRACSVPVLPAPIVEALESKYPIYRSNPLIKGGIRIDIETIKWWAAREHPPDRPNAPTERSPW